MSRFSTGETATGNGRLKRFSISIILLGINGFLITRIDKLKRKIAPLKYTTIVVYFRGA